ncbi:MAG: hypothetical protein NTU63_03735 [Candidatus Pacearchaeota archaeon]|nr:hypothetical protein [Candidatus Pacearchaeota archaeon]
MEIKKYMFNVGDEVDFTGSFKERGIYGTVINRKRILFGLRDLGNFLENIYAVCIEGEYYSNGKKERFLCGKVMFRERYLEKRAATKPGKIATTKLEGIAETKPEETLE